MPHDPGGPAPERPNLRELEVLRAVIVTRKTTTAALRLGISQPAVSRAIAQLEARLGRALFSREGGRLTPTSEALALNKEAEPIFATLARLVAWPHGDRQNDVLRLIAPATIAHRFIAPLIADFLAREPRTFVQFEIGKSDDVVSGVADGRFDLGVSDTPSEHAGVVLEPFRRARAHLALRADHPLAACETIRPQNLADVPFIALTRRFAVRAVFDRLLLAAGVTPRVVAETATSTAACLLVEAGVGVALLNPFPLSLRPADGLVFRPFVPDVMFESCFVFPALEAPAACARHFADFVRATQPADAFSNPI